MGEDKKYYLVEINKEFKNGTLSAYKIFKEENFNEWVDTFYSLTLYKDFLFDDNLYSIEYSDFKITPIDRKSYKAFKTYEKLSYGITQLFDSNSYADSLDLTDLEGEKWECSEANDEVHYKFINSVNDVLINYIPSWDIPDEFLDKLEYIGRRYAILKLTEDIDPYIDDRFSSHSSVDKIWNEENKEWEYHIRLKSQQKPFYV